MRITGPESEFMDGFRAAAKDDAAEFKRLDARIAELEAALRPFAVYAAKRDEMPMRGLGDSVHLIHGGTEHETEITMQHCREARRVIANQQ